MVSVKGVHETIYGQVPDISSPDSCCLSGFFCAGIPSFNINWRWIAYEAACLMFETGCDKQLILLNDRPFFKHVDDMILDGFNYAHHRYGKQMTDDQIFYMPSERQSNYLKHLDEVYPQITAQSKCGIFSYWNWPLTHLINYCREQNFAIPDQVSLIGAIDSEMLRTAPLAITAFEYDREKLVENAFNSLLERINNKQADKNNGQTTQIYGKLIKRATTCSKV